MEFLVIGLVAGVLSGLFGIGGGVVIVPALIFVAQMSPETATGTSLASLLLPVGALGAWYYYRHGLVEIVPAVWIAAGLVVGAWLGAHVALRLSEHDLQKVFAVFLVFVAGHLWFAAR
ncbi:MAG: sulfite exporter TauE/SafE family protein [Arenicellales bacterium]